MNLSEAPFSYSVLRSKSSPLSVVKVAPSVLVESKVTLNFSTTTGISLALALISLVPSTILKEYTPSFSVKVVSLCLTSSNLNPFLASALKLNVEPTSYVFSKLIASPVVVKNSTLVWVPSVTLTFLGRIFVAVALIVLFPSTTTNSYLPSLATKTSLLCLTSLSS